jgi:thymidylate synthase
VKREPLPYPKIRLNPEVTDLFAFTPGDFELVDYQYHPKLHVPVAT